MSAALPSPNVRFPGAKIVPGELDGAAIKTVKRRCLAINKLRLSRVHESLLPRQKDFLDLLPLLFHTNHPLLPGFIGRTAPVGVADYTPDAATLRAARRLTKSFEFRRRAVRSVDILGIYLMGSSGTVAYSRSSDFDIWLCHRGLLDRRRRAELAEKADAISEWAATLGLEMHCFPMVAEEFRSGLTGALTTENSGSTQHYLLLDEFYRTGLLLAGRYPIWWLVPPECDREYDKTVQTIEHKRFVKDEEYLDFGTPTDLPASEFLSSTFWQLSKAIGAPHKSLLKLMLLEAYASEYPDVEFLSTCYKREIFYYDSETETLDPYVLLFQKVQEYLDTQSDPERLELARRSFYFKVGISMSSPTARLSESWRREILANLIETWGWSDTFLVWLDHRDRWKIDAVERERTSLVNALMGTYRLITRFAKANLESISMETRDLQLLRRKLFAAYEHQAGKVELINPNISRDVSEKSLVLEETGQSRGWNLRRDYNDGDILKRSLNPVELLAWAFFNKVVNRATHIRVASPDTSMRLRDAQAIIGHLRDRVSTVSNRRASLEDLAKPPSTRHISMLVNIGRDPMQHYSSQGKQLTSANADAFSYGGLGDNLVQSIDFIAVTTWNEILVNSYESEDQVLEAFRSLANWTLTSTEARGPNVCAQCFTDGYGHLIGRRTQGLMESVRGWASQPCKTGTTRSLYFRVGNDYAELSNDGKSVNAAFIGDYDQLLRHLGQPNRRVSHIDFDRLAFRDSPLPTIFERREEGSVNCFFQVDGERVHVYVIDELGGLFTQEAPFYNDLSLLNHWEQFLESVRFREHSLDGLDLPVGMFRLIRRQIGVYDAVSAEVGASLSNNRLHVQVIGDRVGNDTLFTLFCNGKEFSTLEHGSEVFRAVAQYVVDCRARKERYEIHISDIDLSKILASRHGDSKLRTIQYLQYKQKIEGELNEALATLER